MSILWYHSDSQPPKVRWSYKLHRSKARGKNKGKLIQNQGKKHSVVPKYKLEIQHCSNSWSTTSALFCLGTSKRLAWECCWRSLSAKYEKQVCLQILHTYSSTKIAIRDRMRKKGTVQSLGEELYTLSNPRDHPRNFINFFWKTLQNLRIDGWTKEKEIWAFYDTVLTLNRQRWGEAISSTGVR